MLDKLTRKTFEPRTGETFKLTDDEAGELELELRAVQGTGLEGRAKREQFALHFDGPADPLLPQKIYRLDNPETGPLEIFLVPIARDDDGTTYEAVFT